MTQTDTQASDQYKLTGHISRPPVEIGTRHIHADYQEAFAFNIGKFGPAEIELVLHDFDIFSSLLRNHPTEMTEAVNNVLTGRTGAAVRLASQIGLTEEAFLQRGGGPVLCSGIVFCATVIFIAAAFGKIPPTGDPPPPGTKPNPIAGQR